GDGATSEGDFHEALNLAAVWQLPVVFVIENNGYGLSTPTSEQYMCENLADRAKGYGMHGFCIDGNNIFEVMETIEKARELALKGEPVLIEAKTFRMRGHEEASGTHYIPDILFENWIEKDPILRVENFLEKEGIATKEDFKKITKEIDQSFKEDLTKALNADDPVFNEADEMNAVYSDENPSTPKHSNGSTSEKRFVDALQISLRQAFEEDEKFLIMGQDIAEYGGVFKITEGFLEQFGKGRIRNTPIIESGVLGAAMGLALEGYKPVVEMQFADFISCGFNQIVNNIAKSHYRWTSPLNITIRAPHGGGVGAGPFHSQSVEGWFMQIPGLKVVVPGTVEDAQNLLYSSLYDPNPVLFFEHKKLYRSLKETVPDKAVYEPLGKAKIRREGTDATIITYGMGVQWAMTAAEEFAAKGVELEVLDLRCLLPLDKESIKATVQKTAKVLLLQEPSLTLGPLSEIAAIITEECFEWLDAPVMRCSSLDMPIPHDKGLEDGFMANMKVNKKIDTLLDY
ncbi:MAG: dehydrogenase E1 component subunit alpha/beta, partial [Balneolaceae bacterium]